MPDDARADAGRGRDDRDALHLAEIARHHGEGLVGAKLAQAEPADRGVVPGVHGELVPAEALQRDDAALREE